MLIHAQLTCELSQCVQNPDGEGAPCLACLKAMNARGGGLPCLRYKITEVRLFKSGQVPGFEWTNRWIDNISDNIGKWASDDVKTIQISKTGSSQHIELRVRRFEPFPGDKVRRTWVHNGTQRSVEVPPYALVNLDHAKQAYSRHIMAALGETLGHFAGGRGCLIRLTYKHAAHVWRNGRLSLEWKSLLTASFKLWMAVRLSTTSDFIVGEEKLGMPDDILDETSPHVGKIPVPPVLGAQLDIVLIHHIQTSLRRELLDRLQGMFMKSKPSTWLVTYLVTFMLLHNAALLIKHDAAYARKHGMRVSRRGRGPTSHFRSIAR